MNYTENASKLLILDGNSVLHRAYYALPDWRNRSGEATAGVYGFLAILLKAIEDLKPTHLAIVFDHPSPTFRHHLYVGYQTNREKDRQISEDIWGQIDKLKIVFERLVIPVFQIAGFEADDIIGTLSKQAKCEVVIITGDRDLMQLVDDKINLYMAFKGISNMTLVDRDKVRERLGVWPEQVVDYKALTGDSSDHYPGVPGIGPKTAISLLEKFGSFEKIYTSPSNPSPNSILSNRFGQGGEGREGRGIVKKLITGYESGELSKRLATIRLDAPITLNIASCQIPPKEKIVDVLQELGYKSLIRRIDPKTKDESSTHPRLFE